MKYFEEYILNKKTKLRNALVMAPMTTYSGNKNGTVSDEELIYYKERAKEVGMVITATTYTMHSSQGFENQFYAGHDDFIPSLKNLADVIKSGGAKAILQIFHPGRMAAKDLSEFQDIVSASPIPAERVNASIPRELKNDEIEKIIESFYEVTIRSVKAGFDGIEIHGANTYLIQQFFSPHSNRRTDEWGGNIEKRLNFPLRIVDKCIEARKIMNKDNFIIGYRFSPEEKEDPGITLEDTLILIDKLSDKEIDYLHVSLGIYNQSSIRNKNNFIIGKRLLKTIKNRIPLIGVGSVFSIDDLKKAEDIGYDLMAIGRGLIIEPNFISVIKSENKIKKIIHNDKNTIPNNLLNRIKNNQKSFDVEIL
jgi:2,4-dienoyl-CoA reductase-like NADH-dependent reductase (Old Yellow Enzyme family)